MNKILIAVSLVLFLGAGCSTAPASGGVALPTVSPAPTARIVASGALAAEARVVPTRSAALGLPGGGVVAEVLVSEGDQVEAGQVLLRLGQARSMAMVAQAEAELAQAQAAFEQLRAGATPQEIAAAEAQLHVAEAQ